MPCLNHACCDFCDARCGAYIISEEVWKDLCIKYGKWCSWKEVEGMGYIEAENYIKNMPTWVPM